MAIGWRIVKKKYAGNAFDGEGARLNGGRWTSVGRPAVYTADSIALATLEVLVNIGVEAGILLTTSYVLFRVGVPDQLVAETDPTTLPKGWSAPRAPPDLARIGDAWLDSMEKPVLRVPSAVTPGEWNFILNPLHPDFRLLSIGPEEPYSFDPRLNSIGRRRS